MAIQEGFGNGRRIWQCKKDLAIQEELGNSKKDLAMEEGFGNARRIWEWKKDLAMQEEPGNAIMPESY
ncbi:MAG: hypothetical protein IPP96_17920 [Chitinophagaceae bacterium]|nr:hypothetical protein [Chitinophagaceae bacterium]